jgi:cleavage stimulation factor subunit 2
MQQQHIPTDAITALLHSMNANQLFDLMNQMKVLAQTNADQAKQLLAENPQLSYALFQAMTLMKLIAPQTIQVTS